MKIEAVDFFYLSMPEVTTAADGSQDALLVRVRAGGLTGWGECEASPLVSICVYGNAENNASRWGVRARRTALASRSARSPKPSNTTRTKGL